MKPITILAQDEAAELLGVSKKTLERWRVHGDGPPFLKIGKRVGYDLGDLRAYLDSVRRRSTGDNPEAA